MDGTSVPVYQTMTLTGRSCHVDAIHCRHVLSANGNGNARTYSIGPAPRDASFDDVSAFCSTSALSSTSTLTSTNTSHPHSHTRANSTASGSGSSWLRRAMGYMSDHGSARRGADTEDANEPHVRCAHGTLFCLDTNGQEGRWAGYESFTLRLSWAASVRRLLLSSFGFLARRLICF